MGSLDPGGPKRIIMAMPEISIKTSASALRSELTVLQRDSLPWITARTLTRLGQAVKAAETAEIKGVFNAPTPWTVNSVYLKPATKTDSTIRVGFKDAGMKTLSAGQYLQYQIDGGARAHKRFEKALIASGAMLPNQYAVPTKRMQIDQHGNMRKGLATKILSDLNASSDPTQNRGNKRLGRGKMKMMSFFAITRPINGLAPGIYLRMSAKQQVMVLAYTRQPSYRKRLDWNGVAARVITKNFAVYFREEAAKIKPRTARSI